LSIGNGAKGTEFTKIRKVLQYMKSTLQECPVTFAMRLYY